VAYKIKTKKVKSAVKTSIQKPLN